MSDATAVASDRLRSSVTPSRSPDNTRSSRWLRRSLCDRWFLRRSRSDRLEGLETMPRSVADLARSVTAFGRQRLGEDRGQGLDLDVGRGGRLLLTRTVESARQIAKMAPGPAVY